MRPTEIIFGVTETAEGGHDARALGHGAFAHGDDWDDLKTMTDRVVALAYERVAPP